MTQRMHLNISTSLVRGALTQAVEKSDQLHALEKELIIRLREIDDNKYYVRYGYNSLSGFCTHGLKFTKTQTQRIVTQVRRYIPMSN